MYLINNYLRNQQTVTTSDKNYVEENMFKLQPVYLYIQYHFGWLDIDVIK